MAFLSLKLATVRERAGRAVGMFVGSLGTGGGVGLLPAEQNHQQPSLPTTLWIPAILMIITVSVAALLVPENGRDRGVA